MAKRLKLAFHPVVIRGRAWKLFVVQGSEFHLLNKDIAKEDAGALPFGYCDFSTEFIVLNADFPLQACLDTILHEVSHAIFSLHAGSKANKMEQIDEELACNLLGYALPEVIPQYNNIVKFIKQQWKLKNNK